VQEYCATIAKQVGLRGPKTATDNLGKPLPVEKLDHFEDQQIAQLYELRKSIAPLPAPAEDKGRASRSKSNSSHSNNN
jgi:hypothetical protein